MFKKLGKFGVWLCGKRNHKFTPWTKRFTYEERRCSACLKYERRAMTDKRPSYVWLFQYLADQKGSKPRLLIPMIAAIQALAQEGTPSAYLAIEAIAHDLGWKPQ